MDDATASKAQARPMAPRISGITSSDLASSYALPMTLRILHPPDSCVASPDMPFMTYVRVPPFRGEQTQPSNAFFHDTVVPDAAIPKPNMARADAAKSGRDSANATKAIPFGPRQAAGAFPILTQPGAEPQPSGKEPRRARRAPRTHSNHVGHLTRPEFVILPALNPELRDPFFIHEADVASHKLRYF